MDPPEIYNLATDPFESKPISKTKQPGLFNELVQKFSDAINNHTDKLEKDVTNQMTFMNIIWKPHLQPCCGPFPHCTCIEKE